MDGLNIEHVDTLNGRNRREHNTNLIKDPYLVVRRGQPFWIDITFNKDVSNLQDFFYLKFEIGANPQNSAGTRVVLPSDQGQRLHWDMHVMTSSGYKVSVTITPPSDCFVGRFQMTAGVSVSSRINWIFSTIKDVYILFNPWLLKDTVYMPNEDERQEYVLNQRGIIYNGNPNKPAGRPWNFGQFQKGVLDACLYIMDVAKMPIINRRDVIKVIRMGSAIMNSQDDRGVLVGNWSGDYGSETAPTAWTGSPEILDQYVTKSRPVAFAQCWVYAGVFNTFLRCLGIPARVVSNFRSAHDSDGNLKIDVILTSDLQLDTHSTRDSLWNYHCWNECYLVRTDLPVGFGGWQVVDSTPRRPAMLNGDIVFRMLKDGRLETVFVDRSTVGKMVLTKAVGHNGKEDITHWYKFPEGTLEERMAAKNAEQYGCIRQEKFPDADVELYIHVPDVEMGDDFQVTLHLRNTSMSRRTVDLYLSGNMVFYTGVHSSQFKFQLLQGTLNPWRTEVATVNVHAHEYMSKILEQRILHFIVIGRINETKRIVATTKMVTLLAPKLIITVAGNHEVGEKLNVTVEFTNTVRFDLVNVTIRMEISGHMVFSPKRYRLITRGSTVKWSEYYVPETVMHTSVMASLECATLRHVYGEEELVVTDN